MQRKFDTILEKIIEISKNHIQPMIIYLNEEESGWYDLFGQSNEADSSVSTLTPSMLEPVQVRGFVESMRESSAAENQTYKSAREISQQRRAEQGTSQGPSSWQDGSISEGDGLFPVQIGYGERQNRLQPMQTAQLPHAQPEISAQQLNNHGAWMAKSGSQPGTDVSPQNQQVLSAFPLPPSLAQPTIIAEESQLLRQTSIPKQNVGEILPNPSACGKKISFSCNLLI